MLPQSQLPVSSSAHAFTSRTNPPTQDPTSALVRSQNYPSLWACFFFQHTFVVCMDPCPTISHDTTNNAETGFLVFVGAGQWVCRTSRSELWDQGGLLLHQLRIRICCGIWSLRCWRSQWLVDTHKQSPLTLFTFFTFGFAQLHAVFLSSSSFPSVFRRPHQSSCIACDVHSWKITVEKAGHLHGFSIPRGFLGLCSGFWCLSRSVF